MKKAKKIVAILIVFSMVMAFIPFKVFAITDDERQNLAEFQLNNATSVSIENGKATISYLNGKVEVEGENLQTEERPWNYGNGNEGTINMLYTTSTSLEFKTIPNDGYLAYYWNNGQRVSLENNTYLISNIEPISTNERGYFVEFTFEPSSQGGEHHEGEEPFTGPFTPFNHVVDGEKVTSKITYNHKTTAEFFWDPLDIFINESMIEPGQFNLDELKSEEGATLKNNEDMSYNYDGSGYVYIDVSSIFMAEMEDIIINGTSYKDKIPQTIKELYEAFNFQHTWVSLKVPYSTSYDIQTITKDATKAGVGNFDWTYNEEEKYLRDPDGNILKDENDKPILNDNFINHAKLEVVKVEYDGNTYTEGRGIGTGMDFNEDTQYDGAVLPAGSIVTLKLTPEYGYQLTSFSINGGRFETGDNTCEYSFEVPQGNFHLGADFTKVGDEVDAKSEKVKSGSIKIAEDEIDSGTVVLSVNDVELTDEKISEFESVVKEEGEYKISSYLDIDLDQVIYKGTEDDVWSNRIHNLNNEALITLQLEDGVDGENVVIVHNINDSDEYEIIKIESYDKDTNTITFKTKSFSNYAIAEKVTSDVKTTSNPKTGDNILEMIAITLFAGIMLMFTFKFRNNK